MTKGFSSQTEGVGTTDGRVLKNYVPIRSPSGTDLRSSKGYLGDFDMCINSHVLFSRGV